ncbi:ThuA domain-containing protein [Micromonospora sp. CA-263727]|uniref:ThuA domain-containing protein n=1 Tax=Micromonospora sp. CA-263727 TaxID=3239967 RepID=UPI003D91F4D6
MARSVRRWLALFAGAVLTAPLLTAVPATAHPGHEHDDTSVLVFHKTAGERRDSINKGISAIRTLGSNNDFTVDVTQAATAFTAENLASYDAVIFLNTTGEVLNTAQKTAFEGYIRAGGGFVGVHAAAETEPNWPFYQQLVGAKATSVAPAAAGWVTAADRVHPATATLPREVSLVDKWYNFDTNVRGTAHVLATVSEKTYTGGTMGYDHPIAWCQDFQGGRSFYTGLGDSSDIYGVGAFRKHLVGGIQWAAGQAAGDCGATVQSNYEKVVLNDRPGEPMTLAVLPDGRVLHNSRTGAVRMYDPATGLNDVIAEIPVYTNSEDGLQSVAIDPDFTTNRWVYFYYAPRLNTPMGSAPADSDDPSVWDNWKGYNQLSRAKLVETPTPHLDMSTEQKILRVDADRGTCCHVGGEIKFDGKGLLYLVTGDNTNASGSDNFAPVNEMPTRGPAYDAQRSAANTNDLRGKLLRIKVKADGTYSIPAGNLFPPAEYRDGKTRPEIFLMGLRNPFRFDVDAKGFAYIGDYSPDSRVSNPDRGPAGTGRWIATNKAGNYGWPYCYAPNLPYIKFDYATRTSHGPYNCAAPVNDSPRNTGLRNLPPVQQAQLGYTFSAFTPCPTDYLSTPTVPCGNDWPVLGTGGVGPMGGPIYKYDPNLESDSKFPAYFDNTVVFGEFTRNRLFSFQTNGSGKLQGIEPLLSGFRWDNPMDMEFGPDGHLYVLEYGNGFFRANPEAKLSVVRYVKNGRAPVAKATSTPSSGQAPLTVRFSAEGSYDSDPGDTISYAWDFLGDGTATSTEANPTFTFTENGVHQVRLTVTDSTGKSSVTLREIVVGNTAPTVRITSPTNGSFFNWGDRISWTVEVTDPEDGQVDCGRVQVSSVLGHDSHGHGLETTTGCSGTFQTRAEEADHAGGYLFLGLSATYTDLGANGQPALSDTNQITMQTWRQEAENAQEVGGVATATTNDVDGVLHVTQIQNNAHLGFRPIDLGQVASLTFRVAGGAANRIGQPQGTVEVRLDSPTGELVTTATVNATGSTNTWQSQTVPLSRAAGEHTLYLVFKPATGGPTSNFFNLNWVEFGKAGP